MHLPNQSLNTVINAIALDFPPLLSQNQATSNNKGIVPSSSWSWTKIARYASLPVDSNCFRKCQDQCLELGNNPNDCYESCRQTCQIWFDKVFVAF